MIELILAVIIGVLVPLGVNREVKVLAGVVAGLVVFGWMIYRENLTAYIGVLTAFFLSLWLAQRNSVKEKWHGSDSDLSS